MEDDLPISNMACTEMITVRKKKDETKRDYWWQRKNERKLSVKLQSDKKANFILQLT